MWLVGPTDRGVSAAWDRIGEVSTRMEPRAQRGETRAAGVGPGAGGDGTGGAADGTEGVADGTEGLADGTEGLADGDGGIAASSARRTGGVIGRRSETATGTGAGSDIRV